MSNATTTTSTTNLDFVTDALLCDALNYHIVELRREYIAKRGTDCADIIAEVQAISRRVIALGGTVAPVRRGARVV